MKALKQVYDWQNFISFLSWYGSVLQIIYFFCPKLENVSVVEFRKK